MQFQQSSVSEAIIRRTIAIGCISSLILCVGIYVWVQWSLSAWEPFVSTSVDYDSIEANADIQLPPSTRDVFVQQEGLNEIHIRVRFSINASDLDRVQQSSTCTEAFASVDPRRFAEADSELTWWTPGKASIMLECSGGRDQESFQRILVDTTDPTTYIVYISAGTR